MDQHLVFAISREYGLSLIHISLQVVGQQQVALLRRRVGTAHGIVRVRVHDVVQVHADAPHDLVLAGYLRAVLHQRRIGQRARRRRFDADRRKRLAVNREHDIVALALSLIHIFAP